MATEQQRQGNRILTDAVATTTTIHTSTIPSLDTANHILALIIVPLTALIAVAMLSLLITYIVRRNRSLPTVASQVFRYDANDPDGLAERDGWESELLDDTDPPFLRDNQSPIVRTSNNNRASPTLQIQT